MSSKRTTTGLLVFLAVLSCVASRVLADAQTAGSLDSWHVIPLADDYVELYRSADPRNVYGRTPGLALCPNGRLIATFEIGGDGARDVPLPPVGRGNTTVLTSDDHGATWDYRTNLQAGFARPFVAGDSLYVLGRQRTLMIARSDDWGTTWTPTVPITKEKGWHQSACNVHYANGNVYLVMERFKPESREPLLRIGPIRIRSWRVSELAPVLMRAEATDDLTRPESWTFASELFFCDAVPDHELDWFGVPFYPAFYPYVHLASLTRPCSPIGWLETNVVQIVDPDNYWHDPTGRTFHLWMRAHTGGTNLAAICKVVEKEDGSMETMLETVPSGKRIVFVPCPGGQMRFHILYDEKAALYWLLSSQSTDSMTRADRLPADRYSLPNNERHRLQLHFSTNCMDWCFAGLVAVGPSPRQARHYASMVIDGDDLHILSRSGDAEAKSAHDGNIITFHTVRDFRRLVY